MADVELAGASGVVIPEALAMVVEALWTQVWEVEPPGPTSSEGETQDWLVAAVKYSDSRAGILTDVRSLLTAYARELAEPRPPMGQLAAAQGISITSLRRRYSDKHVTALQHLLNDTGLIDDIIQPFSSLYDEQLRQISDSRDREIAQRHTMARLYVAHEYRLAEQIGISLPTNPSPDNVKSGNYLPPPDYSFRANLESGTLHPGRRRRLMTDYNSRIMEDALRESDSELLNLWQEWTAGR